MKRTATGRPTISFCLIVRNASKTLETTLKSIRALTPQAEICIVDTMSSEGDASPEIARRYADKWIEWAGPNGTWTRDMVAFDDAGAARNKSFELASGKWVGWIDADDELVDEKEASRLLAANGYLFGGRSDIEGEKKGEIDGVAVLDFESFLKAQWEKGEVEGFYAPYLYRFKEGKDGEAGKADEWQVRERIVRSDEKGRLAWSWKRRAHEVLVADDASLHSRMMLLSALLFVHRKEWSDADIRYSVDRHHAIVKKEYDAGKRDFFDLYYLCTYAPIKEPERREQYLNDYLAAAGTPGERARAHYLKGCYLAGEGYFMETLEAFQAGVLCDPELPDNYFGTARTYARADRWLKAAEAYAAGAAQPYTHPFERTTPREHAIVNRVLGGLAFWRAWKAGAGAAALENAIVLVKAAFEVPGARQTDGAELTAWLRLFENELRGARVVEAIGFVHQHLVENDETAKAAKLAEIVPHNMEDTFQADALRTFARKIARHASDPAAYQDFYTLVGTDVSTSDAEIEACASLRRVQFANTYLQLLRQQVGRPLRVLEIGTWDGITLCNSMERLPDSTFVGIEASAKALGRLEDRVKARGWGERFRGVQGILSHDTMLKAKGGDGAARFDAIVFYEVIEHLVDPTKALEEIRWALDEQHGRLFVSTPWGAYDRGAPADKAKRDPRGHVHAFTPRALFELLTKAGFRILEMNGDYAVHAEGNFADTQMAMAEINGRAGYTVTLNGQEIYRPPASPTFVVPAALWDWNATSVEKTGMGASEETIVYLAREMGRKGGSPTVFGPLPKSYSLDDQEVRSGVAYWPREQISRIDPALPVVVSRLPSEVLHLEQTLKTFKLEMPKRMFLWLQDTWYGDLTPAVAQRYKRIVCLSHWHRETLAAQSGIELSKFKIIPNFILKEHFPDVPSKVLGQLPREKHRLIYCSSPDRGLLPLLRMWSEILKRWPDATLGIYYGWEGAMKLASINPDWAKQYRALRAEFAQLRHQPGIQEFGRVNHSVIAHEMRRSSVWAYPIVGGRSAVETFCSNAVKARAAGCVPVTVPEAALVETANSPVTQWVETTDHRLWVDAIGRAFEVSDHERDAMAKEAIEKYELAKVLPLWEELLK